MKYILISILFSIVILGCNVGNIKKHHIDERKRFLGMNENNLFYPFYGFYKDESLVVQFFPFYIRVEDDLADNRYNWREYSYSHDKGKFFFCQTPEYLKEWNNETFLTSFCRKNAVATYQIMATLLSQNISLKRISGENIFKRKSDIFMTRDMEYTLTVVNTIPSRGSYITTFIDPNTKTGINLASSYTNRFIFGEMSTQNDLLDATVEILPAALLGQLKLRIINCGARVLFCQKDSITIYKYNFDKTGNMIWKKESGRGIWDTYMYTFHRVYHMRFDLNPYLKDYLLDRDNSYKGKTYMSAYDSVKITFQGKNNKGKFLFDRTKNQTKYRYIFTIDTSENDYNTYAYYCRVEKGDKECTVNPVFNKVLMLFSHDHSFLVFMEMGVFSRERLFVRKDY